MNPILETDFYKIGHILQYPKGITRVYTNFTPRKSRLIGVDKVVSFGLLRGLHKLRQNWQYNFFFQPWENIEEEYSRVIRATLRIDNPPMEHIKALHSLGYLPLQFWGVPEGEAVPFGCPVFVCYNTHPEFFWLPNYLETQLSAELWKGYTSATLAKEYYKLLMKYARMAGTEHFVPWQAHDFSYRGMSGVEDAINSGLGHLLFFSGTDTIPAIVEASKFYGTNIFNLGGSVPATEHSVMCAGGKEGEQETFERLLDTYPKGILSIVSDTWDLWKVLTEILPSLKDKILAREGKLVIRPDSGDPKLIVCGFGYPRNTPERKGVVQLLGETFGFTLNKAGLKVLNKVGVIYGDGITLELADSILSGLISQGWSPENIVFGVGSFTYQYQTRDTFGFAMKATACVQNGELVAMFKSPVTDNGLKKSHRGIVAAIKTGNEWGWQDNLPEDFDFGAHGMRCYFINGVLPHPPEDFETIRRRAAKC